MAGSRKDELYGPVLERLSEVLAACPDESAALASVAALLKESLPHFFWVGFYRRAADGSLRVGPYQGPPACPVLAPGSGVCGEALKRRASVIVSDVDEFPGHVACDPRSKSEIVVPVTLQGGEEPWGVLDVDSEHRGAFDETDQRHLEAVAAELGRRLQ